MDAAFRKILFSCLHRPGEAYARASGALPLLHVRHGSHARAFHVGPRGVTHVAEFALFALVLGNIPVFVTASCLVPFRVNRSASLILTLIRSWQPAVRTLPLRLRALRA